MTIVLNVRSRRRDFSSNVADSDAFELAQAKKKKQYQQIRRIFF